MFESTIPNDVRIYVSEDGTDETLIFVGNVKHWEDCFFSNPTYTSVITFALQNNWQIKFISI